MHTDHTRADRMEFSASVKPKTGYALRRVRLIDAPREALHVDPTPVAPIMDAVDLALVETPRLVALIVVVVEEGKSR